MLHRPFPITALSLHDACTQAAGELSMLSSTFNATIRFVTAPPCSGKTYFLTYDAPVMRTALLGDLDVLFAIQFHYPRRNWMDDREIAREVHLAQWLCATEYLLHLIPLTKGRGLRTIAVLGNFDLSDCPSRDLRGATRAVIIEEATHMRQCEMRTTLHSHFVKPSSWSQWPHVRQARQLLQQQCVQMSIPILHRFQDIIAPEGYSS